MKLNVTPRLAERLHQHVLAQGLAAPLILLDCPRCRGELVERFNPSGQVSFWGCTRYPGCSYTEDLWRGIKQLQRLYQELIPTIQHCPADLDETQNDLELELCIVKYEAQPDIDFDNWMN